MFMNPHSSSSQKQPKWPSTDKWMSQLLFVQRKEWMLTQSTTWLALQDIMPIEKNPIKKDKCYMMPFKKYLKMINDRNCQQVRGTWGLGLGTVWPARQSRDQMENEATGVQWWNPGGGRMNLSLSPESTSANVSAGWNLRACSIGKPMIACEHWCIWVRCGLEMLAEFPLLKKALPL